MPVTNALQTSFCACLDTHKSILHGERENRSYTTFKYGESQDSPTLHIPEIWFPPAFLSCVWALRRKWVKNQFRMPTELASVLLATLWYSWCWWESQQQGYKIHIKLTLDIISCDWISMILGSYRGPYGIPDMRSIRFVCTWGFIAHE